MTEHLIETLIEQGVKAYKKNHRGRLFGRRLDRHEPVKVEGVEQEFRYWKEMAVYFAGEYIKEHLPQAIVNVHIDGNNSNLEIEIDDVEEESINKDLLDFFNQTRIPV